MAEYQETPQVVFEVIEDGIVVYRDAITYETIIQLRNDNAQERQAKFQQRYQNHLQNLADAQNNPSLEPPAFPQEPEG